MSAELSLPEWEIIEPISGDASSRRYFRVRRNGQRAILMDCRAEETIGHSLKDFIMVAKWLNDAGLNAPDIYEYDESVGYVVVEDFGSVTLSQALASGESAEILYGMTAEIANVMAECDCKLDLPRYDGSYIHEGSRRVIDYYAPVMTGRVNEVGLVDAYINVWDEIEGGLPPCPQGFLHMDYHAQNLMWVPQGEGLGKIGIIDFQGAMIGPVPYDLSNILEDPRQAIDKDLRAFILSHYDEEYQLWYRVLGTQFHCRVIGQFLKMALAGRVAYLDYIPITYQYLRSALSHPVLKPMAEFFQDSGLDFAQDLQVLDLERLKPLICDDAF